MTSCGFGWSRFWRRMRNRLPPRVSPQSGYARLVVSCAVSTLLSFPRSLSLWRDAIESFAITAIEESKNDFIWVPLEAYEKQVTLTGFATEWVRLVGLDAVSSLFPSPISSYSVSVSPVLNDRIYVPLGSLLEYEKQDVTLPGYHSVDTAFRLLG